jgi:hypothetical protein
LSKNIFYGFLQHDQIQKAQTDMENAKQKAQHVQNEVYDLSARLDALVWQLKQFGKLLKNSRC